MRGRVNRVFAGASKGDTDSCRKKAPGGSRGLAECAGGRGLIYSRRRTPGTSANSAGHRRGSHFFGMPKSPPSPSPYPSVRSSSSSSASSSSSMDDESPALSSHILTQIPVLPNAEDEEEEGGEMRHEETGGIAEKAIGDDIEGDSNTDSAEKEAAECAGDGGEQLSGARVGENLGGLWARQTMTLDRIATEQSELLGERNRPETWRKSGTQDRSTALSNDLGGEVDDENEECEDTEESEGRFVAPASAVSRWERYLRTLPADFFRSAEARMQTVGDSTAAASFAGENGVENVGNRLLDGTRRRCMSYAGLSLCHAPENCPDLLYVYEQVYEIKIRRGGRKEGYQQFRGVAGQLARFAVAVDVVPAESFSKAGGLFELATSSKLVRAFIGGFQTNAQASTVYSKATLLGLLCRMAKLHFGKITSAETAAVLSSIDETTNLLGSFRRVEKATSRRQTAVQRDQDRRETFIHTSDWYTLQRRIEQDMASVFSGVCGLFDRFGEDSHAYMDENHALVRKYSLLMVVYILLNGGGQRPQAYASLQHPRESVLRRWEHEDEEIDEQEAAQGAGVRDGLMQVPPGRVVKLYPLQEKTPRGTFCPGILFPNKARSFFIAYSRVIRPAIMRCVGKVSADALSRDRTFLVHTETGNALTGENLRNTLRFYVGGLGGLAGDLSRVTVMTVRASYASVMFQSYRRGKFPGLTAEQFLGELAETMNTSIEMLRTTYIATNGSEFDEAAGAFLRASREE
jgi:hypothetical protein